MTTTPALLATDMAGAEALFNATGFETFNYGVHICPLGEEADTLLALGHHHDERRQLAAFLAAARNAGFEPCSVEPDDITPTWATFRAPAAGELFDETDGDWIADWSTTTSDTPGAIAVTVLQLAL